MRTLYYSPGACSLAAHIVLEEIGEPFDAREVRIREGEHLRADYLAINPLGRVPTLMDGEFTLSESPAILTYLAHKHPGSGLIDWQNDESVGRTLQLLSFFASSVHVAFAQVWRSARYANTEASRSEIVDVGKATVESYFQELEDLASNDSWLVARQFSIADPYMLVFYRWGELIGLEMNKYAHWSGHKDRMLERTSVQRAVSREGLRFD
jgi:glutathione S-transferase